MSKTLGVYFPCYKNRNATEFALKSFRKAFPQAPVFLYSDLGDDFSDLADDNCRFSIAKSRIGGTGPLATYSSEKMIECWNRHKLAVDYCNTDYIMVLEDDVWVRSGFEIKDDFAIKGTKWGRLDNKLVELIEVSGGAVPRNKSYGLCGGAIYNTKVFLEIFDDVIKDISRNHDAIKQDCEQVSAMDCNMVFHFAKRGHKYEWSEWLSELSRPGPHNTPVLHGYREYYPK